MVQQARARVTRDKIMQGAAEVIREVGYANASLGQISEAAGVTKGALYFHFNSKEEIARALIDEQHRITREAAKKIMSHDASAIEHMVQLTADLAGRLVGDPIVRAGIRLTTDSSTFDSPIAGPYQDWMETFEQLAMRAQHQGETNGVIAPDLLARFIIPAFTGVQLVSEAFTGRRDLPERVHEMWKILIAAVVAEDRQEHVLGMIEATFSRLERDTRRRQSEA
ncbi:ScbR family autoregulator-binding transcription factor [Agromyces larvae]|uniref:TetR/AcrR family transcriptional regulator n=1 Tax=Agromyces larvae TaxID=2929802 RepID=A0ABY4BUE8_9MICO|nr:ScbR family autoregulator-binding transcription factor [Agromyces larvae]UOE42830.1 TetR/AcrR family transcriptional regulator [Agromyces larvae]